MEQYFFTNHEVVFHTAESLDLWCKKRKDKLIWMRHVNITPKAALSLNSTTIQHFKNLRSLSLPTLERVYTPCEMNAYLKPDIGTGETLKHRYYLVAWRLPEMIVNTLLQFHDDSGGTFRCHTARNQLLFRVASASNYPRLITTSIRKASQDWVHREVISRDERWRDVSFSALVPRIDEAIEKLRAKRWKHYFSGWRVFKYHCVTEFVREYLGRDGTSLCTECVVVNQGEVVT